MALSNIFNEPRREITESVVGIGIVAVLIVSDYPAACWFQEFTGGAQYGCPWRLGLLLIPVVMVLVVMVSMMALFATHALGDAACDALQRRGIHLRPRNRPGDR